MSHASTPILVGVAFLVLEIILPFKFGQIEGGGGYGPKTETRGSQPGP